MENYIGTKCIQAKPMTRGEYNVFRGWVIPPDENPNDKGYVVKYSDGYVSWSPAEQFEKYYRKSGQMNFGHALELLKQGEKLARSGWNGRIIYIQLSSNISNDIYALVETGAVKKNWMPSQADMFAEDWFVVNLKY